MDLVSLLGQAAISSPPLLASFLLGVMTSISPCPLGSNLAAVAFLSRNTKSHKGAAIASLAYSAGRSLTYIIVSAIVGFAGMAAAQILFPLQSHYTLILSIILVIAGLLLLGKLRPNFEFVNSEKLKFLSEKGTVGAFLLGVGLALVFCPISAALFLGGVVPLVISTKDWLLIPFAYGLGTAIPVLVLPQIIHTTKNVGKSVGFVVGKISKTASMLLGIIFVLAGIYYFLLWLRIF
jgi:cytochrome c biogenesis protein CcdA